MCVLRTLKCRARSWTVILENAKRLAESGSGAFRLLRCNPRCKNKFGSYGDSVTVDGHHPPLKPSTFLLWQNFAYGHMYHFIRGLIKNYLADLVHCLTEASQTSVSLNCYIDPPYPSHLSPSLNLKRRKLLEYLGWGKTASIITSVCTASRTTPAISLQFVAQTRQRSSWSCIQSSHSSASDPRSTFSPPPQQPNHSELSPPPPAE